MHIEKDFSWLQVISAAVSAGLAGEAKGLEKALKVSEKAVAKAAKMGIHLAPGMTAEKMIEEEMLYAGTAATAQQFLDMATGLTNSINLEAIAESVALVEVDWVLNNDLSAVSDIKYIGNIITDTSDDLVNASIGRIFFDQPISMESLGVELLGQVAVQEVQAYVDSNMHAHTAMKDKTGITTSNSNSNSNEPADKSSIPVIAPNGQVMLPVVGMSHPHASKVVAKQTAKRQQRLKRVGQTHMMEKHLPAPAVTQTNQFNMQTYQNWRINSSYEMLARKQLTSEMDDYSSAKLKPVGQKPVEHSHPASNDSNYFHGYVPPAFIPGKNPLNNSSPVPSLSQRFDHDWQQTESLGNYLFFGSMGVSGTGEMIDATLATAVRGWQYLHLLDQGRILGGLERVGARGLTKLGELGQSFWRGAERVVESVPPLRPTQFSAGLFRRVDDEVLGADAPLDTEAANHINILRLNRQLTIEQGQALTDDFGHLIQEALNNSELIVPGRELGNQTLKGILEARGGNISDWGKYATPHLDTPSGGFSTHFYYNPVTNDAYYGMDYKSVLGHEGEWNLPLRPSFNLEPPKFNP